MNKRGRALLSAAVGAALLLVPASVTAAGKPVKGPQCSLSTGVVLSSMKTKNQTAWVITGTTGDDIINCTSSTAGVGVTIFTRGGNDTVYGTPMADTINVEGSLPNQFPYVNGNAGNDYIRGGFGDSTSFSQPIFEGGPGDDQIIATGGAPYAYGNDGNDSIDLTAAWNGQAQGGAGNDTIHGPNFAGCNAVVSCANPLFGDAGNDVIYGGAGRDDLEGGTGTDQMYAFAGDDLLIDSGSGIETFDCGDGSGDVIQDLDGNGVGGNGTGYLGTPEDDIHTTCETVLVAAAPCSFTPGTTGCAVLTNVAMTDNPSTATYLLSGTITFTPTCNPLVPPCDYAYPNIMITGSGTFSVSGSQTATGTWTVPPQPNDRPNPSTYQFLDASSALTTCNAGVIRQITLNLPLVADNGDTGGGYLTVRTDDVGTSDVVGGTFFIGPLPVGTFRNPVDSQAGVAIYC